MTINQSVVDEEGDVIKKQCKDGVGATTKCLVGTRANQMKKEDKMVDRMFQKFLDYIEHDKN